MICVKIAQKVGPSNKPKNKNWDFWSF